MSKEKLYFKYLRNEKNESCDYQYEPPIYGESNTDISYYEPNSTRIANMKKSASGLSTGAYDFDEKSEVEIEDVHSPLGRKPGMTFEEISQIQTRTEMSIKSQSKQAEKDMKDSDELVKQNIKQAVDIANAIDNRGPEVN